MMLRPTEYREFRATAVAKFAGSISDEELEALHQSTGPSAVVRYDSGAARLHMVWRFTTAEPDRAIYDAMKTAQRAFRAVFGDKATLVSFTLEWL